MSQQQAEKREAQIFSARQALVDLKAKLALASLQKKEVQISGLEARMLLTLIDERTPWSL